MPSFAQRDETEEHLKQDERRLIPFGSLLFSGGGNDIVGDQFYYWLRPFTPGASAPDLIDAVHFGVRLTMLEGD